MTNTPPSHRRRWFQFSLSSLFWLLLVMALAMYGVRERLERQRLATDVARQEAEYKILQARHSALLWDRTFKPSGEYQGGFNFGTSERDKTDSRRNFFQAPPP